MVIGLAIGLLGPFVLGFLAFGIRRVIGIESLTIRATLGLAISWLVTLALVAYVVRIEHRPLASIGWRGVRWTYIATSPLWWLLGTLGTAGLVILLRGHLNTEPADILTGLPVWTRVLMVITAAVTEEVAFRGYLMERLHDLTGHIRFAAVLSALVFAAAHMPYWGVLEGLVRLPMGVVLSVRYARSRSLLPPVIVHFIADAPLIFGL